MVIISIVTNGLMLVEVYTCGIILIPLCLSLSVDLERIGYWTKIKNWLQDQKSKDLSSPIQPRKTSL